jgi:hypothetical protein
VNPGTTQLLGKVTLPVAFRTKDNYRTKNVTFDMADIPFPYNEFLG